MVLMIKAICPGRASQWVTITPANRLTVGRNESAFQHTYALGRNFPTAHPIQQGNV
ncbi:MAG: hypothetical protein ACM3VS_14255 [Candidatus Dadabacteria bacterium]